MRPVIIAAAVVYAATSPAYAASSDFHVAVSAKANVFGAAAGGVKVNGGGLAPVRIPIPAGASVAEITQVRGKVSCCSGSISTFNSANGGTRYSTNITASGGISGLSYPGVNLFLVGVFVGATMPQAPAPLSLNVSKMPQQSDIYARLNQTFFVGDGYFTRVGTMGLRRFHIPAGSRYFVLGFADAGSFNGAPGAYDDNVGSLDVRGTFAQSTSSVVPHLGANWTYRTNGKMRLTQMGKKVTMYLSWTPNPQPAPHYVVNTILSGLSLDGTWHCLVAKCGHASGKFHAPINSSGNRITVSNTQDPGGANQWNGTVFMR